MKVVTVAYGIISLIALAIVYWFEDRRGKK